MGNDGQEKYRRRPERFRRAPEGTLLKRIDFGGGGGERREKGGAKEQN
jgi:hypothetical protein